MNTAVYKVEKQLHDLLPNQPIGDKARYMEELHRLFSQSNTVLSNINRFIKQYETYIDSDDTRLDYLYYGTAILIIMGAFGYVLSAVIMVLIISVCVIAYNIYASKIPKQLEQMKNLLLQNRLTSADFTRANAYLVAEDFHGFKNLLRNFDSIYENFKRLSFNKFNAVVQFDFTDPDVITFKNNIFDCITKIDLSQKIEI
jgi:hypothetical protein